MSATEAAADAAAPAAGAAVAPPVLGGTVGDIRDALGFDQIEDLAPDDRGAEPADEVAAKRDEKATAKADAKADDAKKPDETEDDVAIVRQIEARAKARRQAARKARQEAAPKPSAQTQPAPAPAAAKPPERAPSPVEAAVKDVLAQIERLASGDAAAAAAAGGAPAPDTDERKAALTAIQKQLGEIGDGLKASGEDRTKLTALEERMRGIESDRIIRQHVTAAIDKVADDLPTLTDPKAIRAFNREHGTQYADAVEMIGEAAERYFTKYKVTPNLADLAKRIEQKLKGNAPEQKTAEKPKPSSKTVSRNDGAPPATRRDPDDRSFEEAMSDFDNRFG